MRDVTFLYLHGRDWYARKTSTDLPTVELLKVHPFGPEAVRLASQVMVAEDDGSLWLLKDDVGDAEVPTMLNWGRDNKSGGVP